jgi:hypothetical protein
VNAYAGIDSITLELRALDVKKFVPAGDVGGFFSFLSKSPEVRWKKHTVVVSNRSLRGYRGSSLPVSTPHAEALVAFFEHLDQNVLPRCPRAPAYYVSRLAQRVNDFPDEYTAVEMLEAVRLRMQELL